MNLNHQIEYQEWIWIYIIYLNHQFEINWIPFFCQYHILWSLRIWKVSPKSSRFFHLDSSTALRFRLGLRLWDQRSDGVNDVFRSWSVSVKRLVEFRMILIMFLWYVMMFHDHQHQRKNIIKWRSSNGSNKTEINWGFDMLWSYINI